MRSRVWGLLFAVLVAGCGSASPEGDELEQPDEGMGASPTSEPVGVAGAGLEGTAGSAAPEGMAGSAPVAPTEGEPEHVEANPAPVAGEGGAAAGVAGAGGMGGTTSKTPSAGSGGSSGAGSGLGGTGGSAGSSGSNAAGQGGSAGSTPAPVNPTCTCNTLVSGQPAIIAAADWCWARADQAPPATSPYSATKLAGCRSQLEAQAQGVDAVRAFCCGDE